MKKDHKIPNSFDHIEEYVIKETCDISDKKRSIINIPRFI